jgi:hypothetical protein
VTKFFLSPARAALSAAQFSHQRGEPRPVSNLETLGDPTLADASAERALTLVELKMGDLHLDFGKLNMLMRVERLQVPKFLTAAHAWFGGHRDGFGRLQKRLPAALVALFTAGLTLSLGFSFSSLFAGAYPTREVGWSSASSAPVLLPVLPRA